MANRTDLPSQISTNPDYLLGFDRGQPVAVPFSDPNGANAEFPSSVSGGGAGAITSMTPTDYYHIALRSSQSGSGSPVDASGKLNDPTINTSVFPAARQNNTAYSLGAYRSPTTPNGRMFKVTTAGTSGATEPVWNQTIAGTTTDGTVTWTCEQGPWGNSAAGFRHLIALESASLGALGHYSLPVVPWDLLAGDSIIIRLNAAWHYDNDSRTNLSETSIMGSRHASTNRRGLQLIATGGVYCDLKFVVSDGTTTIASGHVGDGQLGRPLFGRKPGDGNIRDTVWAIDGQLKRSYCWTDGVAWAQNEMFSGSELTPHNRDLSTIAGSTLSPNTFLLGTMPGSATTFDFGFRAFDIIVFPARGLPANMQAVANFFSSRGADSLLPASLLI